MLKNKLNALDHYKDYYNNGDRREIFKLIVDHFEVQSALYPGSYIHIAPSLYIQRTVYVDSYKKTEEFFNDKSILEFILKNRNYNKTPMITYYNSDYNLDFVEKSENFDLLISLYAGFVSQGCKKYLKKEGLLLANNTHGDASMAYLDNDYEFIAAIYRSNRQYRLTYKNLEKYFIPKNQELKVNEEYLKEKRRGIGYTKTANAYLFRKIKK